MRVRFLLPLIAIALAACGAYQAPAAERSDLERRQTSVALAGRPTLAPLPTSNAMAPTARPLQTLEELLALSADDPRALGSPTAPVTLIELTDFE